MSGDVPLPVSGAVKLECAILHSLPSCGSCMKFERIAMKKLGEDVVVAFLGVMSAIDPHLKYMQHHSLELSSYTMISCIKLKQSGGWDF